MEKWKKNDYGSSSDILHRKCTRRSLNVLFYWSKSKIRELGNLEARLEMEIVDLQMLERSDDGLSPDQEAYLCKVHELNSTLVKIISWRQQRAKIRWLRKGDANSHIFHPLASRTRTNASNAKKKWGWNAL